MNVKSLNYTQEFIKFVSNCPCHLWLVVCITYENTSTYDCQKEKATLIYTTFNVQNYHADYHTKAIGISMLKC